MDRALMVFGSGTIAFFSPRFLLGSVFSLISLGGVPPSPQDVSKVHSILQQASKDIGLEADTGFPYARPGDLLFRMCRAMALIYVSWDFERVGC